MSKKTFSWLEAERRPSEYSELTVRLGRWGEPFRGTWPDFPDDGAWYHVRSKDGGTLFEPTELHISDWYVFRDRSELTYRSYNLMQNSEEEKLDAVLETLESLGQFARVPAPWVELLKGLLPALRHYEWGMSQVHQFVARFTPSSTIGNVSFFQIYDELRHAQRYVELVDRYEFAHGSFPSSSLQWTTSAPFQPLRECTEKIMATYDWAEAAFAANFLLEAIIEPIKLELLSTVADAYGDLVVPSFNRFIRRDEDRHVDWIVDLLQVAFEQDERNRAVVERWKRTWYPLATRAGDALASLLGATGRQQAADFDQFRTSVHEQVASRLVTLGIAP